MKYGMALRGPSPIGRKLSEGLETDTDVATLE
jgi:hypothetical protein